MDEKEKVWKIDHNSAILGATIMIIVLTILFKLFGVECR